MFASIRNILLTTILLLLSVVTLSARTFAVQGRVVNEATRSPIAYAAVTIDGQPTRGAVTNERGEFVIEGVEPGLFRVVGQSLGYEVGYSQDIQIAAKTPSVEILLAPTSSEIDSIVVRPSLFRRMVESPVSMRRVGVQQIEKSPGANRDVSRIVQSLPGVAFSPAGYRNDLLVRGGSPAENKFYVDGIEIPNINHFSTQGASGGPVSILNADLIREIDFYTAAFPVRYSGAMSSVMDVKLRDGDSEGQNFKATLGASEVSLSGSGHIGDRTTYLFSLRQSYLQLLFRALSLPFLPNFIDGQAKVKHEITERDEVTVLALIGVDDMTLNEEGTSESAEYILGYLPRIQQQTVTAGVRYRRYGDGNTFSLVASHSYVNNRNIKYQDNDESVPDNLNLDLTATEQKTTIKSDNRGRLSEAIGLRYGAQIDYIQYGVESYKRVWSGGEVGENIYDTYLGYMAWGVDVGADYSSSKGRLSASRGARMDGNGFSSATARLWEHFSPRLSLSYELPRGFSVGASSGIYYAMPALTALSYQEEGVAVNSGLGYSHVGQFALGVEWRASREIFASIEGFYKIYRDLPISVADGVPLADVGDDYGVVGDEAYVQSGVGRAYGVELSGEWQVAGKVALVGSLTLYRSEYATSRGAEYRPSSWDNRVIFNNLGTYFMSRGWSVGAKISAIGGAPYTPYDVERSSSTEYWDVNGQPAYDYSAYNTKRLEGYAQLDLRVDKMLYFRRWMLGLYIDIQNVTGSEYAQPDIPISTGVISADDPTRYEMKYLRSVSDTIFPTFGVTAQF